MKCSRQQLFTLAGDSFAQIGGAAGKCQEWEIDQGQIRGNPREGEMRSRGDVIPVWERSEHLAGAEAVTFLLALPMEARLFSFSGTPGDAFTHGTRWDGHINIKVTCYVGMVVISKYNRNCSLLNTFSVLRPNPQHQSLNTSLRFT